MAPSHHRDRRPTGAPRRADASSSAPTSTGSTGVAGLRNPCRIRGFPAVVRHRGILAPASAGLLGSLGCGSGSVCSRSCRASPAGARRTRASSTGRWRGSGGTSTRRSCRRSPPRQAAGSPPSSPPAIRPRRARPAGCGRWGRRPLRPGALGRHLDSFDVVHYPLTVPVPRTKAPSVVTLLDVQHLDLPNLFSRGERLFRSFAYDRAARHAERVIVISHWVRERVIERLGLATRPRARDPPRCRPRAVPAGRTRSTREPFLLYPARPWPHKNHARLFEAFATPPAAAPGASPRPDGNGPRPALAPRRCRGAGRRAARWAHRPLPPGRTRRLPEPLRRVRPTADRGDGLRLSGRVVVRRLAGRGLRRRRAAVRPAFGRRDGGRRRRGARVTADWSERGPARAAGFTWDATARAHDSVYDELA